MPLLSGCQLPPPSNWQDFESLCVDLWREEWKDTTIQRNGRSGQTQNGVDIVGRPDKNVWGGIQCKCIPEGSVLSESDLISEVAKAKNFYPSLSLFIVANTGLKDVHLENAARSMVTTNSRGGHLDVVVYSWADICSLMHRHTTVAQTHFPFATRAAAPIILKNDGTDFGQHWKHLRYSFTREEFIHPRIVEELLGFMSDRHETGC